MVYYNERFRLKSAEERGMWEESSKQEAFGSFLSVESQTVPVSESNSI